MTTEKGRSIFVILNRDLWRQTRIDLRIRVGICRCIERAGSKNRSIVYFRPGRIGNPPSKLLVPPCGSRIGDPDQRGEISK